MERYKQKEAENGRTNNGYGGRDKRCGSKGKGHGGGNTDTREGSNSAPTRNGDSCRYCGKLGHWAKECRSRKRDQQGQQGQQAQVAQVNEPTLLVHIVVITTAPSPPPSPIPARVSSGHTVTIELTPVAPTRQRVRLVEEKVFAVLDDRKKRDSDDGSLTPEPPTI